jgi:hypothetical protein
MHRTETLDYGIVTEGEVWLVLDEEEVQLKRGDVVVQRGATMPGAIAPRPWRAWSSFCLTGASPLNWAMTGSQGMKLATLKNGSRDGRLVIVSRDLKWALDASPVALTLQQAIENWESAEPRLQALLPG